MNNRMVAPDTIIDWRGEPDVFALKRARARIEEDKAAAIHELRALSEKGSPMAMLYLGAIYLNNEHTNPKPEESAIYWYSMALDRGSIVASFYLGDAYKRANLYDQAIRALRVGADRKFVLSMWLLGWIYFEGKGVPRDIHAARKIWKEAMDLGHVRSRRHIAHMYINGNFGLKYIPLGIFLFSQSIIAYLVISARNINSDLLK